MQRHSDGSTVHYWNRHGKSITRGERRDLLKLMSDSEYYAYKRIGLTELSNGKHVSTVWVGTDADHLNEKYHQPRIFETIVFSKGSGGKELDMDFYATEQEAMEGHNLMVEKWSTL